MLTVAHRMSLSSLKAKGPSLYHPWLLPPSLPLLLNAPEPPYPTLPPSQICPSHLWGPQRLIQSLLDPILRYQGYSLYALDREWEWKAPSLS